MFVCSNVRSFVVRRSMRSFRIGIEIRLVVVCSTTAQHELNTEHHYTLSILNSVESIQLSSEQTETGTERAHKLRTTTS